MEHLDIETLFELVIREAKEHHDGHFTLFSFTTGFKCAFGTPDLDTGDGRKQLAKMQSYNNLQTALADLILNKRSF